MDDESKNTDRRKLLKNMFAVGLGAMAVGTGKVIADETDPPAKETKKIKVLTTEGEVIEIEQPVSDCKIDPCSPAQGEMARRGIPGRGICRSGPLFPRQNAISDPNSAPQAPKFLPGEGGPPPGRGKTK